MFKVETILCPVDFSEVSVEALKCAVDLKNTFNSRIILFHAVEPIVAPADFTFGSLTPIEVEEKLVERAKGSMRALAAENGLLTDDENTVVVRGTASSEIVRAAYDLDVDLIVMGTHGYTGMVHVLLGSTAERVLRKAPCPVMTLRKNSKGGDS